MNTNHARALVHELLHRIAPEADVDAIDPDEPMQEELDLDSMDFLNLLTELHSATGVDVPEADYPRVSTFAGLSAYVAAATGG